MTKKVFSYLIATLMGVTLLTTTGFPQNSRRVTVSNATKLNEIPNLQNSSVGLKSQKRISILTPRERVAASDSDWDWTEDSLQTLAFYGIKDSIMVRLPWFLTGSATYEGLGNYVPDQIDFHKRQGWVLLYKDFGPAVANPVFILYNRYRGILRYFFWNYLINGSKPFDYGLVELSIGGYEGTTPLFTFYPGVPQFSDEYLPQFPDNSELCSITNLQNDSWCYADFNLTGFDDQIGSKYSFLNLQIWGIVGYLNVNENLPLNNVIAGGNSQVSTALNVQVSGSEPIMNAFKEIKGLGGLHQEIANNNDSMRTGWRKNLLARVAGEASSTSPSWIGDISSLAGIADGFIGIVTDGGKGNEVSAAMPFIFNGMTALSGTITPLAIGGVDIPVPGSWASVEIPPDGKGTYDSPLGIFNVVTEPTVGYCYKVTSFQSNSGVRASFVYGLPHFTLESPVQIVYNPFDGLTLASATAALVDTSHGPVTAYTDLNSYSDFGFVSSAPVRISASSSNNLAEKVGQIIDGPRNHLPSEIALQLKFTFFDSLTSGVDTVYFLKTYPVKLAYDPSIADLPHGSMSGSDSASSPGGLPPSVTVRNFPNPFNPATTIAYQLKAPSHVTIMVYNSLGQRLAKLADEMETTGYHSAVFDGSGFASGLYLLRFIAQPQDGGRPIQQTEKLLLMK